MSAPPAGRLTRELWAETKARLARWSAHWNWVAGELGKIEAASISRGDPNTPWRGRDVARYALDAQAVDDVLAALAAEGETPPAPVADLARLTETLRTQAATMSLELRVSQAKHGKEYPGWAELCGDAALVIDRLTAALADTEGASRG